MDVDMTLFPRVELRVVGIAPLTSMFLFDETNRGRLDDYRPEVHDSDGLQIVTEAGERFGGRSPIPPSCRYRLHDPAAAGLRSGAALALIRAIFRISTPSTSAGPALGSSPRRLGPGIRRTRGDPVGTRDQRQHRGVLAPAQSLTPGIRRISPTA
jgi:hypothetical protein